MSGTEEFTPEETAALAEMQTYGEPVEAPEVVEAPEAPAAPVSAPVEAPKPEPKADKPPEGYVPHGALHAEREERKKAEKALAEMAERLKALEKPAEEPKLPDPLLDPDGFAKWQKGQAEEQNARWAKFEAEQKAQTTARERAVQAEMLEMQFAGKTPDYAEGVKFLVEHRQRELALMGWSPEQAQAIMQQDANALFDNAVSQGRNPAELLYESAKLRGYAGKPPSQAGEQIKAMAAAQENSATLSSTGGEAQVGTLTMTQIAAMSEDEYAAKAYDKNGKLRPEFKRAMGA